MVQFLKKDKTSSQDLTAAALSYTTDYLKPVTVEKIMLHFSAAVTEAITITLDSKNGADYDTVLRSVSLVAETDYVYTPDEGVLNLQDGDQLKVQCTNANLTGEVFVTVKAKELN